MNSDHWISIPYITCIHCGKRNGRSIAVDTIEPPWQLLRDNFFPSPEDEIHTRSLVSDAKLELKAIDRDITQLQAVIHQLEAKRARIDAYTRGHEGIGAHIRRLPNEILCKIFGLCLSGEMLAGKKDETSSRWKIIRVNFHWRQLALSYKQLWASVNVKFRNGWKLPYQRTAFCIKNSGTSPTNLFLENMTYDGLLLPPDFPTPVPPKHFTIRALTVKGCVLQSISQYQDSVFCNLEALDFLVTDAHTHLIERLFKLSPGLTRVSFEASYGVSLQALRIPWYQITCLILNVRVISSSATNGDVALKLLSEMPHLVELGLLSIFAPLSNNQFLVLPNVRTFHVSSKTSDFDILQVLVLPALAHFNIQLEALRNAFTRSMTSLFERSACKLESLLIVDHNIPQLPLLFPYMPTLKELDIRLSHVPDDIFTKLIWTSHSDTTQFLPCLESIKIRFSTSHQINFNTWAEIVNSRCMATPCSPRCQTCIFPARLRKLQLVLSRSHLKSSSTDLLTGAANDHRIQLFLSLYQGNEVNSRKYFESEIARL